MEEEVKSPFAYLLVAMNYAKAAVLSLHERRDGHRVGEVIF